MGKNWWISVDLEGLTAGWWHRRLYRRAFRFSRSPLLDILLLVFLAFLRVLDEQKRKDEELAAESEMKSLKGDTDSDDMSDGRKKRNAHLHRVPFSP